MDKPFTFSVFTKPWKTSLPSLGKRVRDLGFEGIELPVRPGYQVEPDTVGKKLPEAVRVLGGFGIKICSIASPTDEPTIAACAATGVPVIRVCVGIEGEHYLAEEARLHREFDLLVPLLERYGVTMGVQNHCGHSVANAMQLRSLIQRYPPKQIAAVWDAAHNALNGEEPEHAIDIVWSHLCMVNLKNAFWWRKNGPEAEWAEWETHWTTGRHGLASWPRVAEELKRRNWSGVICLSAEYSNHDSVNRLIAEDIAFAKSLYEQGAPT